jgi:outer membrane lipoprotein-sorting protein
MLDPTGKQALKHSRRPLTFAGMANMLRLVIPQCEKAKANGDLTLKYEGIRHVDGRPAYVFKRVLPQKNDYPCPVLIIYIDRQFLTCVRTDAYDWDGTLLSQYIYTDVQINPGLKDEDFSTDNREYNFRLF